MAGQTVKGQLLTRVRINSACVAVVIEGAQDKKCGGERECMEAIFVRLGV
jgi:hypothetical protein